MEEQELEISPEEIEQLIADREAARKAKDFARADEIRNKLDTLGIELMDSADGTTWRSK